MEQFLSGALSFSRLSGEAGALYDITDEIQAYEVQTTIKNNGDTKYNFSGEELPLASQPYVIDRDEVIKIGNAGIPPANYANLPTTATFAPTRTKHSTPTLPPSLYIDIFNYINLY